MGRAPGTGRGSTFPNVLVAEEGVSMLYEGASDAEPNSSHLGVATSPDGITWERPASPAVSPAIVRT